jgi:hypothetical protein
MTPNPNSLHYAPKFFSPPEAYELSVDALNYWEQPCSPYLVERRQRSIHDLPGHAVGKPKMARQSEAAPRNDEDQVLLHLPAEGDIILDRRAREEIEGTLRLDHVESCLGEPST